MDAIIFDIDGTLADVGHRRHLVTQGRKDWGRFFDEMVNDPPLANVCLLAEMLSFAVEQYGDVALFLCSGRPDNYRSHTEARSEEHTSELQSLMRISYAVFCLKKQNYSQF